VKDTFQPTVVVGEVVGEVVTDGDVDPAAGDTEPESTVRVGVIVTGDASFPEESDSVPPTNMTAKITTIMIITIYIED
jgi:hypothetical protein